MQLICINIHLADKGPLAIKCTTFIQILAELDLQGGRVGDPFCKFWWMLLPIHDEWEKLLHNLVLLK